MCHVDSLLQNTLGVCKDAVTTVVSLDRVESFPSFTNGSGPLSGVYVLVQPGLRETKLRLLTRYVFVCFDPTSAILSSFRILSCVRLLERKTIPRCNSRPPNLA